MATSINPTIKPRFKSETAAVEASEPPVRKNELPPAPAAPATTKPSSWSKVAVKAMERGATGPAVRELQEALEQAGFDPGGVDGDFGPKTEAAVRAFQSDNNLIVDGKVGAQTRKALGLAAPEPKETKAEVDAPASKKKSTMQKVAGKVKQAVREEVAREHKLGVNLGTDLSANVQLTIPGTGGSSHPIPVVEQPAPPPVPVAPTNPPPPRRAKEGPDSLEGSPTPQPPAKPPQPNQPTQPAPTAKPPKTIDIGLGLSVNGRAEFSEAIALRNTKTFDSMVKPDRRRLEYATKNPDATWAQTKALVGGGATASVTLPLGPVSLGFSGGVDGQVEISSITAHHVKGAKDLPGAVADQAKSMVAPFNSEWLLKSKQAPGSEWMFRGTVNKHAGAGVGVGTSVGGPLVAVGASAGIGVNYNKADIYTKNVKVLEDGKVFVQIAKDDITTKGLQAGARVGVDVNIPRTGGLVANAVAGKVESAIENKLSASVTGYVNRTAGEKAMGAAVLDLKTAEGRATYDKLMKMSPDKAAKYIHDHDLGPKYKEQSQATGMGFNATFFGNDVISMNRVTGTTKGVVTQVDGSKTKLQESQYAKHLGGFLPRLFVGEERDVKISGGQVVRPDGSRSQAVAMNMAVKDPRFSAQENTEMQKWAKLMGTSLKDMPGGKLGEVRYDVQLSLSDDDVKRLSKLTPEQVYAAYGQALADMDGTKPPTWAKRPDKFEGLVAQAREAQLNRDIGYDPRRDYIDGRDFDKDATSFQAAQEVAKQIAKNRGKPVNEWGKFLSAVGSQGSTDVRAIMLTLHRLAQADLTGLSVRSGKKTFTAPPAGPVANTLAAEVGKIMGPPA